MIRYLLVLLTCLLSISLKAQLSEAPENTRYYYDGIIEDMDHIQLNLHVDGHVISGAFVLESSGQQYFVLGRMSHDKTGIGIRVYDGFNKYVASIEAEVVSEEKNFAKKLKGVYKPVNSTDFHTLLLQKIAEFASKDWLINTPLSVL